MRGIFFSILALIAVLLTALGLMIFRPSVWRQASAQISALAGKAPSTDAADKTSPFKEDEQKDDTKRHFTSRIVGPAEDQEIPALGPPDNAKPSYRFPRDGEIVVGTSKSDVLAAFGPARVTVTGADLGQLYERLVYTDQSTGEETLVIIRNGKVFTSRTYRR
jgi:hypothetical protein